MSLKSALKGKIPDADLEKLPRAFDVIGSRGKAVAIIEIPEELAKYERYIADAIMKLHKSVKSVLKKASPRKGALRLREHKLIAGEPDTEVIHVEAGCRLKIDPQRAYFSPREAAERARIAERVRPNEVVMVFFAGVGPFAIIIAKKAKPGRVIGIEINPDAIRYFRENVALNKLRNIDVVEGDVRKQAASWYNLCDRVLMPLPESAIEYVDEAIKCTRPGGIVHLYCFAKEEELSSLEERVANAAKKLGRSATLLGHELVLPWGPRIWKARLDFMVR
ncbi:MAG: class I SAM-dependent methyltransferase family protein [Candidatus Aenigmatarchaeota archaeon]